MAIPFGFFCAFAVLYVGLCILDSAEYICIDDFYKETRYRFRRIFPQKIKGVVCSECGGKDIVRLMEKEPVPEPMTTDRYMEGLSGINNVKTHRVITSKIVCAKCGYNKQIEISLKM